VKTAVAFAAAFVGVLALVARSAEEAPVAGLRPVTRPAAPSAVVRSAPVETLPAPLAGKAVEPKAIPPAPPGLVPPPPALEASGARTLTGKLERELGLSAAQRAQVEEIFRAREGEVAEIQERVLKAGYFVPRQTDPELTALREQSYRRISMLLDAAQNRRFAEVLERNLINDHLVIELSDNLVVLE
jgi:hypothetical protein